MDIQQLILNRLVNMWFFNKIYQFFRDNSSSETTNRHDSRFCMRYIALCWSRYFDYTSDVDPNPDSFWSLDLDPDSEYGSGFRISIRIPNPDPDPEVWNHWWNQGCGSEFMIFFIADLDPTRVFKLELISCWWLRHHQQRRKIVPEKLKKIIFSNKCLF